MLITIFLISLAAAVIVGGYTFGVLFGKWSRPVTGSFVAPPPPANRAFVPFIPPIAPVAVAPVPIVPVVPVVPVSGAAIAPPPAPHYEQATSVSSVFVTLPMQHQAVAGPTVTARGTTANSVARTAPRTAPRTAKGSVPPPMPSRPVVAPRAARAPEPSDFLDEETYLDVVPTPRR
ncbi:MAG: hypothetical protein WKG01_01495 [Kofleriaceae bacterium]